MLVVSRILAALALVAALIWLVASAWALEAWVAAMASASALGATFVGRAKRRQSEGMSQDVGAHGIAVQAGRDAHVSIAKSTGDADA